MKFKTVDPDELSAPQLHSYILAAVAPRPIALASSIDGQGRVNLSPFSFFNAFSSNPPIMVFSPSRRGRDNTTKDTYDNIGEVAETVINVVSHSMVQQVSLASSDYPSDINEFTKAGLTEIPSQKIRPPRVGESPVAFECTVEEVKPLGDQGGAGNLVICKVVLMHINELYLDDNFKIDTTKLDLVGRMGANWYVRAYQEALFEVAKPGRPPGIGVDLLPEQIRNSKVLTGNNLGKLGNISQMPERDSILDLLQDPQIAALMKELDSGTGSPHELHLLAQELIEDDQIDKALKLLLLPQART